MHHHTQLIFVVLVETGFPHVGQAGLKLLASSDLPSSTSQSAGILGVSHHTQPWHPFFFETESGFLPRLECSGVILVHYNLHLLVSSDFPFSSF